MKKAFEPVVTPTSRILILGTMPGEKSLEMQQYYGNRGNQFWKLMFEILEEPFSYNYNERINLLLKYNIALWDVLQYCEREGSLDSNIKNEAANDFASFYMCYPKIKQVYFTSKNAAKYYDKYVGRREDILYTILSSPSGANATKTYSEKLDDWMEKILPQIR